MELKKSSHSLSSWGIQGTHTFSSRQGLPNTKSAWGSLKNRIETISPPTQRSAIGSSHYCNNLYRRNMFLNSFGSQPVTIGNEHRHHERTLENSSLSFRFAQTSSYGLQWPSLWRSFQTTLWSITIIPFRKWWNTELSGRKSFFVLTRSENLNEIYPVPFNPSVSPNKFLNDEIDNPMDE